MHQPVVNFREKVDKGGRSNLVLEQLTGSGSQSFWTNSRLGESLTTQGLGKASTLIFPNLVRGEEYWRGNSNSVLHENLWEGSFKGYVPGASGCKKGVKSWSLLWQEGTVRRGPPQAGLSNRFRYGKKKKIREEKKNSCILLNRGSAGLNGGNTGGEGKNNIEASKWFNGRGI